MNPLCWYKPMPDRSFVHTKCTTIVPEYDSATPAVKAKHFAAPGVR